MKVLSEDSAVIIFAVTWLVVKADKAYDVPAFGYHQKFGVNHAQLVKVAEMSLHDDISMKIINGRRPSGVVPFQAGLLISLMHGGQSVCGASLISNTRLLTAAHCWWDGHSQAKYFTVVLGTVFLYRGGQRINTDDVITHEHWNPVTCFHDIAMVTVPWISYNSVIKNIQLPFGLYSQNLAGFVAIASGYGIYHDARAISSNQFINYVRLIIINNYACMHSYGGAITPAHICTDGARGSGVCHGDSGGPLSTSINHRPVLLGITSFVARAGCEVGAPSVFTRVSSYMHWIKLHFFN